MAYLKGGTYVDGGISVEGDLKVRSIEFSDGTVALLEDQSQLQRYHVTRISDEGKTKLETAAVRVTTPADANIAAIAGELNNDQEISGDVIKLNYESSNERPAGADFYQNTVTPVNTNRGKVVDVIAVKAHESDINRKNTLRLGIENNYLMSLYAEYGATATNNRSATFEIGNKHIFTRSEDIKLAPDGRTWVFA